MSVQCSSRLSIRSYHCSSFRQYRHVDVWTCSHALSASGRSPTTYPGIASQATSQGSFPVLAAFTARIDALDFSGCSVSITLVSGSKPVSKTCAQLTQRFIYVCSGRFVRAFQHIADLPVVELV